MKIELTKEQCRFIRIQLGVRYAQIPYHEKYDKVRHKLHSILKTLENAEEANKCP